MYVIEPKVEFSMVFGNCLISAVKERYQTISTVAFFVFL